MDKILELLGANKLDEETTTKVKEHLNSLIEAEVKAQVKKAKETLFEEVKQEKDGLTEKYETKFEEYKEEITNKFSDFLDSILEEELVIPEKILEFAKKGELYHDLIEQFKVRLSVDEGLLSEETKSLMKEAKDEILKLKKELNEKIGESLELKNELAKKEADLYLREKSEGFTDDQKAYVFKVLSGLDKEQIDEKFDIVVESMMSASSGKKDDGNKDDGKGSITESKTKDNDDDEGLTKMYEDPNSPFAGYLKTLKSEE